MSPPPGFTAGEKSERYEPLLGLASSSVPRQSALFFFNPRAARVLWRRLGTQERQSADVFLQRM